MELFIKEKFRREFPMGMVRNTGLKSKLKMKKVKNKNSSSKKLILEVGMLVLWKALESLHLLKEKFISVTLSMVSLME